MHRWKKISNICSISLRAKYKFLLVYKKQKKILSYKFTFTRPFKFFIRFFTDCQYFDSNKPDSSINYLPTIYSNLLKKIDFSFSSEHKYYFPEDPDLAMLFLNYFNKITN